MNALRTRIAGLGCLVFALSAATATAEVRLPSRRLRCPAAPRLRDRGRRSKMGLGGGRNHRPRPRLRPEPGGSRARRRPLRLGRQPALQSLRRLGPAGLTVSNRRLARDHRRPALTARVSAGRPPAGRGCQGWDVPSFGSLIAPGPPVCSAWSVRRGLVSKPKRL